MKWKSIKLTQMETSGETNECKSEWVRQKWNWWFMIQLKKYIRDLRGMSTQIFNSWRAQVEFKSKQKQAKLVQEEALDSRSSLHSLVHFYDHWQHMLESDCLIRAIMLIFTVTSNNELNVYDLILMIQFLSSIWNFFLRHKTIEGTRRHGASCHLELNETSCRQHDHGWSPWHQRAFDHEQLTKQKQN